MVNVVSVNINGLRDVEKFQKFAKYCSENYFDIVGVQETFWDNEFISNIEKFWEGKMYVSCSDTQRQGVAFMVSNRVKNNIEEIQNFDGRCIHIKFKQDEKEIDIVNCYAPNIVKDKFNFFEKIFSKISDVENLILLGDMNTSMSKLDRCGKTEHIEDKAYNSLIKICDNFNIYDIWRARNPTSRIFSWRRIVQNVLVQSRIDYIFIPRSFSQFVKNVYYKHNTFSDHSFVNLNIDFSGIERGPGMWVFNNTLLDDDDFVNKISKLIEDEKKCRLYNDEPLIWYDNLKFKIKQTAKIFSQRKARNERSEYFKLQRDYEKLSLQAADDINFDSNKFEEIKLKLKEYEDNLCKGAILRSKAHWAIEGDKNSKFFLQLEKYKQNNNSIKELKNINGELLTTTEEILDEVYNFYKDLYSSTSINKSKALEILSFISKQVSDEDVLFLDSDITVDEIKTALFSMAKNKSPGPCGLTAEFFCKFFNLFAEIFLKIFKVIEEEKLMTRSMRHGAISLVYKNKGDKNLLKNFRPISLLCVDYKIMARIMSNRLKTVLPKLVSVYQTCCVLGRDIADTTASIRDLIEIIENDDLEGYLIKIDQEKAFDKIDHEYLFLVLESFGFGPKFIQWIKIFYTNVNSSVKCNGFQTKYFTLQNSIKQGCPVSALLYVLAAEPLGQAILQNKSIKGVKIPNSEIEAKIFQHADDTNIFTSDKESIDETFKVLKLYSDASGAKINKQKSEIMCLGSGYISDDELNRLQIQRCENVTKILGIYMGKDKELCNTLNWKDKIKKVKTILFFWNKRELTLPGRATVITYLIMSRFYYTLTVCSLPENIKNEIRLIVLKFIWQNKSHLVKYQSIIGDKLSGGLNIPDIFLKMQAFRLKFLKKFLDKNCISIWKKAFSYFLSKVDNLDLKENIVYVFLNSRQLKHLPLIYQEILIAYYRVKSRLEFEFEVHHVYNIPIFCNPSITFNGKMLLFNNFINAGILQIRDICYEFIPGFLTSGAIVEIIRQKYPDENANKIREDFNKILNSIPNSMKILLRSENTVNTEVLPKIKICYENGREINFMGVDTKNFYKLLLSFFWETPTAEKHWEELYPSINFTRLYSVANQNSLPPDCRCLNYRLAHRAIFTLEKLVKIGQTDDSTCKSCGLCKEDLVHLFVLCPGHRSIHEFLKDTLHNIFLNSSSELVNTLNYEQLILLGFLGSSKLINTYFLNFFLSVARLCIYRSRNLKVFHNKDIDAVRLFKYTLKKYIEYANTYYTMKNQRHLFNKYFLNKNALVKISNKTIVLHF